MIGTAATEGDALVSRELTIGRHVIAVIEGVAFVQAGLFQLLFTQGFGGNHHGVYRDQLTFKAFDCPGVAFGGQYGDTGLYAAPRGCEALFIQRYDRGLFENIYATGLYHVCQAAGQAGRVNCCAVAHKHTAECTVNIHSLAKLLWCERAKIFLTKTQLMHEVHKFVNSLELSRQYGGFNLTGLVKVAIDGLLVANASHLFDGIEHLSLQANGCIFQGGLFKGLFQTAQV